MINQKCTGCGCTAQMSPLRLGRPHANCHANGTWIETTFSPRKKKN